MSACFHQSVGGLEVGLFRKRQLFRRLRNLHASGGVEHRLDDIMVAGAAADIALELVPHGLFVEFAAMAMHDVDRRHDHARGAIAALQAVIVAERGLHRVQFVAFGNAFDGGDIGAVGLTDQHGAGFDRAAVDMDDTGTALAGVTADMGAGQIQMIAQQMDQQRSVLEFGRNCLAIHLELDGRHVLLLLDFN